MKKNLDKKLKYPIKVIEKTVKILELFSTDNIKLNYKEIVKLTSINITTTQRILNNLYHYGFLNFNEEDMKYYIGKNLLKLGLIALENSGIGELIRISDAYLRKLNKITNETVSLGTIEMNKTIVLKSFPSSLQTKFEVPIGSSSPLYAGSAGKLFLAYFSDEDLTSCNISSSTFGNMGTIKFNSGANVNGVVFTGCAEVDTNGATATNCTISSTSETTTGSLVVNSSSEATAMTGMNFKDYAANNRYAVYVPASVTSFTMSNWQFDDPDNTTDYALYWAGTSGTLTISKTNGTNLVTAGCTSASGGTVSVVSSVSINVNVKNQSGANLTGALVYIDEDLGSAGNITNTTTDTSGNITQASYNGAATTATVRVRKYGYKAFVGTISLTANSSTNIIAITDPQQT